VLADFPWALAGGITFWIGGGGSVENVVELVDDDDRHLALAPWSETGDKMNSSCELCVGNDDDDDDDDDGDGDCNEGEEGTDELPDRIVELDLVALPCCPLSLVVSLLIRLSGGSPNSSLCLAFAQQQLGVIEIVGTVGILGI